VRMRRWAAVRTWQARLNDFHQFIVVELRQRSENQCWFCPISVLAAAHTRPPRAQPRPTDCQVNLSWPVKPRQHERRESMPRSSSC
jgi:hypothetical protein